MLMLTCNCPNSPELAAPYIQKTLYLHPNKVENIKSLYLSYCVYTVL
uniref:Uncharacterized protein n=1 Tax=Anguilla anguilla TaxID=7936 RepID=A0A0E9RNC2_ANGAN